MTNDMHTKAHRMTSSAQAGWRKGEAKGLSTSANSRGLARLAASTSVAGMMYWIPTPAYDPVIPT